MSCPVGKLYLISNTASHTGESSAVCSSVRLSSNTIWTPGNDTPVGLREGPFGRVTFTDNVLFRAWSDWPGPFSHFRQRGNLVCQWEGTLPRLQRSSSRSCKPSFLNPAADDYRLASGVGVDWAPRQLHYGP